MKELSARNFCYCRLMDELRFDDARTIAEEILTMKDSLPMLFRMETSCDLLLLELITQNRIEVVSNLWTKKLGTGMTLQKYITSYSKYFPLKCATLFAYELINNQSPESAQPYYDEVRAIRHNHAQHRPPLCYRKDGQGGTRVLDETKEIKSWTLNK